MEKTCRLVHITYRENNRGPGREEYKSCETANLNGVYGSTEHNKGVHWDGFKEGATLAGARMMIKRKP